jgi:hypothetical protein
MDYITYKTKVFCQTNKLHSRVEGETQFEAPADATPEELEEYRDVASFEWMCLNIDHGHIGELTQVIV